MHAPQQSPLWLIPVTLSLLVMLGGTGVVLAAPSLSLGGARVDMPLTAAGEIVRRLEAAELREDDLRLWRGLRVWQQLCDRLEAFRVSTGEHRLFRCHEGMDQFADRLLLGDDSQHLSGAVAQLEGLCGAWVYMRQHRSWNDLTRQWIDRTVGLCEGAVGHLTASVALY